jgi:glycosyltransferase involved in cell wall biosynthesis
MRILYLCADLGIPVLGRKGASIHVRELASAFARAGHQVVMVAQTLNKLPAEKPAEINWPVIQVPASSAASAAVLALEEFNQKLGLENSLPGELRRILYNKELEVELKRRFERAPPDVIYERASLYATAGITLAQELKVPLVLEVNAPLSVEQATYRTAGLGQLALEAERWCLSQANAVIVVSGTLRDHVYSLGVDAARVHVLPNGINPEAFHPGARDPAVGAELNLDGGPVLGFVGGLRPWHGVEALPALLERLVGRYPQLRMVIAGDGPLRAELERVLNERGLRDRVTITGLLAHEQIPAIVRHFDVAVAPYPQPEHEFFFSPLKIFEYMACGIATVAPDMGQIAELISHGRTGLLYPAGDLDALGACCEKLLGDAALRTAIGQAAARLVHEQFTWDRNAARILELAVSFRQTAQQAQA